MSIARYKGESSHDTSSEHDFYAQYQWCLYPFQSIEELLQRLSDELDSQSRLEIEWQQQESRINLFLLTCAIYCTVADYPPTAMPSFVKLGSRWPHASIAIKFANEVVRTIRLLRGLMFDRSIRLWQREWKRCVDLSCEILLNGYGADSQQTDDLATMIRELAQVRPERLMRERMQLPSGFRAQDLTHYDVIALADAFDKVQVKHDMRLAIVGVRTAGAYFAPLLHARLQQLGWETSWTSVRPKVGLCYEEHKWMDDVPAKADRVLIVDDHPETGETIRLMVDLLGDHGVQRWKITVVVPSHEAQKNLSVLTGGYRDVELVTVAPQDSYKHGLLDNELRQVIGELVNAKDHGAVPVNDEGTNIINRRLEAHFGDSCQVHLKRVYALRPQGKSRRIRRVLAKSVGWGWLGYHAYLSGNRLAEFVPNVFGLRLGMLFSEWVEAPPTYPNAKLVNRVAEYAAGRTRLLSLVEDREPGLQSEGVSGYYTLAKVLRSMYPRYLRWWKTHAILNELKAYATPHPTFIDGNMGAAKWLNDGSRLLKIDYEHHGFGNPAPNLVDEVYDLANAAQQMNLSPEEQRCMLEAFVRLTGDRRAGERFALYALVCGYSAAVSARFHSNLGLTHESRRLLEAKHIEACNFMTYTLVRFCAEQFAQPRPAGWSSRLFFMDLDGVFDRQCSVFAYTTANGLAALAGLTQHGYSAVVNTGRPVGHAREYCSSYPLTGAIAEYGCVFVDGIHQREMLLIDDEIRERLNSLREHLSSQEGIYLDHTYEVAIRAYRVIDGRTVCLPQELVDTVRGDFGQMTFLSSAADTHIFPSQAGKGHATRKVLEVLSVAREATAAIGDTETDLPMLESVARAYVVGNASQEMLRNARLRKYNVMEAQFQRGLLQAVNDLTGNSRGPHFTSPSMDSSTPEHILRKLLSVCDRTMLQHCVSALHRHDL